MKIYCIKVDTMPFCSEVVGITKATNGTLLRQVSGAYTLSSLIQMFTGKISSDFEPQGVGYYLWKTKRDKDGFSVWPWMGKYIQFFLLEKGFSFVNRNQGVIMNNVLGFGRYPLLSKGDTPWDQHDGNSRKYLVEQGPEWIKSRDDEFTWIDKAQATKGDFFYNINYSHFHAAVAPVVDRHKHQHKIAGQNVLELINHYDFSEPDALFWIFSDHGAWYHPSIGPFPYPEHFYTWSVVKDNSESPLVFPSKVISIQDFYSFVLHKFDDSLQLPNFSKERIYITEDGRANITNKYISTAIACRFENWQGTFPLRMNYLMYHKPADKFLQRVSELDDGQFTVKTKDVEGVDESLMDSLRTNFEWVKK